MTASEQINAFNEFAKTVIAQEGEQLSLEEIQDRWWEKQHQDEDLAAIQVAVDSYEAGERGRPADEFLAERRAARAKQES